MAALFVASPAGLAQSAATEAPLSPAWQQQSFAPASTRTTPLTGDKAIEHLKATGQYESLAAAITAARYAVKSVEDGSENRNSEVRGCSQTAVGAEVTRLKSPKNQSLLTSAPTVLKGALAQNSAHGLNCTFSSEGLTFTVRSPAHSPPNGRDAFHCVPEIAEEVGRGGTRPYQEDRYETGGETAYTVGWRLRSVGYGAAQTPVPAGTLRTVGQRVELTRTTPAVTEWFVNGPAGLEHGFTLPERPALGSTGDPPVPSGDSPDGMGGNWRNQLSVGLNPRAPAIPVGGSPTGAGAVPAGRQESPAPPNFQTRAEPLRLVLAVTGDLTPQADATGQSLALRDAAGRTVLTYAKLKVWDATGAELPAIMQVADGQVTLTVTDSTARYPLTIDPTFSQHAYLKASNTGANDYFGYSAAVSGDTVVVGAFYEHSNTTGVNGNQSNNSPSNFGAAYVFVGNGMTWSQQAHLKASFSAGTSTFGGTNVSSSGQFDIFVARFDKAAVLSCVTPAGGGGVDLGQAIALDTAGYIYVTGAFESSVQFGLFTLTSRGGQAAFLIKPARWSPSPVRMAARCSTTMWRTAPRPGEDASAQVVWCGSANPSQNNRSTSQ